MLQISNVFVNVSKGEVAKTDELQKAFGKSDIKAVVTEVHYLIPCLDIIITHLL